MGLFFSANKSASELFMEQSTACEFQFLLSLFCLYNTIRQLLQIFTAPVTLFAKSIPRDWGVASSVLLPSKLNTGCLDILYWLVLHHPQQWDFKPNFKSGNNKISQNLLCVLYCKWRMKPNLLQNNRKSLFKF